MADRLQLEGWHAPPQCKEVSCAAVNGSLTISWRRLNNLKLSRPQWARKVSRHPQTARKLVGLVLAYQRSSIAPPRGATFPLAVDYTQVGPEM